jgi:hypothetical protein
MVEEGRKLGVWLVGEQLDAATCLKGAFHASRRQSPAASHNDCFAPNIEKNWKMVHETACSFTRTD